MIQDGLRALLRAARGSSADTRRFLWGVTFMGLGNGAFAVHLNLYLRALGMGEKGIGEVLSAAGVGIVLVSLPAALWVDRHPPGRIFLWSAAGCSISSLLMVSDPSRPVLLGCSFVSGMLFTVHLIAAAPFFMRTAGVEHRTELFGLSAALETLAMTAAAWGTGLLAHVLAERFGSETAGLRAALATAAVVGLAAVVPFARIGVPALAAAPRGWRDYVLARDRSLVLKLAIPGFLTGCGAGLTIPFLNLYFRDRFDQSPAAIGTWFALANVLTMTGFLAGPALARRFTHVRAMVATELLSIPFFLLLATTDHLRVALAAFWMRGALMQMNQPISQAFAMEIVPEDQRTVTNSLRMFTWNVAWMASTMVGGRLIEDNGGYAPSMFITMGLYLVAAGVTWTFFRGRVVAKGPA